MEPKIIIKAYDGTNTSDVRRLGVPAGAVGANGLVNFGQGYTQLLATVTQNATEAPEFNGIGINTLSATPVFARSGAGVYTLTLTGAWASGKTFVKWANGAIGTPTTAGVIFSWTWTSANVLTLKGYDVAGAAADWDQSGATLQIIMTT